MKKKAIIIIISVVAVLAVLIAGTIMLLNSKIIGGSKDNSSAPSDITSSDTSGTDSGSDNTDNSDKTDSSGSGLDSSNKTDGNSQNAAGSNTSQRVPGNTTTVSVGTASGKKGDKVSIPVELFDNQGFMGLLAKFNYDTSALKYTGYKKSSLLTDYEVKESDGLIQFMTVENKDVTKNGTMLFLEFEIITDKAQESVIKLTIDKTSIANYDEQLVPVITENGKVTIK